MQIEKRVPRLSNILALCAHPPLDKTMGHTQYEVNVFKVHAMARLGKTSIFHARRHSRADPVDISKRLSTYLHSLPDICLRSLLIQSLNST